MIYSYRWQQNLISDEEAVKQAMWLNAIKDFSDTQIKLALEYCETKRPLNEKGEAWPPNLREFVDICEKMKTTTAVSVEDREAERIEGEVANISNFIAMYGDNIQVENRQKLEDELIKLKKELSRVKGCGEYGQNTSVEAQG